MNRLFFTIFGILFSCFIYAHEIVQLPKQELFEKYWTLVDEQHQEDEALKEWIPKTETEDAWTKSFGVQYYQMPEKYDLQYFYQMFIETLSQDFKENEEKFGHQIEKKEDNHIVFNWWCENPEFEIGREWVHIMKNDQNKVLFVRFATKNNQIDDKDSIWRECLEKADFYFPED